MKDSKTKLLKTAFELFAQKGLDGVSTREIVSKAGVNINGISYYFGGKDGLYKAVLDYLFDFMKEESSSYIHLEDYSRALDGATAEETHALLLKVLGEFSDFGFAPKNKAVAMFLSREEFFPSKYGKKFFERLMSPLSEFMLKAVSKITGMEKTDKEVMLLSIMLLSQVIILGKKKKCLLESLNMKTMDGETSSLIKEMICKNVSVILKEYKKEQK